MRHAICSVLSLLLLLTLSLCFAGVPVPPTIDAQTTVQAPVLQTDPLPAVAQLLNVRWITRTDDITGANSLRLVIDLSGSVEADGVVTGLPTPRLMIQVKGAIPGKMDGPITLDGKVADRVSMNADGRNSQIIIELPLMIEDSDYKVFTLPGDGSTNKPFRVVVDINAPASPIVYNFTAGLQNKTIVLDPGHGGSDSGAIGPGKIQEKAVTLAVALKVKALLEKAGATVLLTRQDDTDVFAANSSAIDELQARAAVATRNKADIFLSIHANAFAKPTIGGSGTYYYQKTPYDALLAQSIQAGLVQYSGLKDRGFIPARFYVLKKTVIPAALAELAFLSNPTEEKLLIDPQFQQKMAQGIAQGIDLFFQKAAKTGGDR